MDTISSIVPSGRLLDIGCGVGDGLVAAREAGFEAVGLDVGDYPVRHCRELGFEVHQASIAATGQPSDSFDVVTMWDVIEHIPRTRDGLAEVARVLKPGGLAVLITPTCEYLRAHWFRGTYRNYRDAWARTHFVYHNRRTLRAVLGECGLDPVPLPLVRRSVLRRGALPAAVEVLTGPPLGLWTAVRASCRLTRNLFVMARKRP